MVEGKYVVMKVSKTRKTGCWGISAVCYRLCNRLCEKISLHRRSEAGTKLCPLS